MRMVGGLIVAALLGLASPGRATTFFADVSAPLHYGVDQNGHIDATGSATFADVVLHVGDDLQLTVEFGAPLEVPDVCIPCSNYLLNLPRGYQLDLGMVEFNYPYMQFVNVADGDSSFAVDVRAYQNYGAPNTVASFDVNSVSYVFQTVPEPATWALMLIGAGMVGAGLRSSRRTAAA
jgi:hypothetical protein